MKNGLEESYVIKENKKLRCGYTTGSCAAAAAQAAARMLFTGQPVEEVRLTTPKGIVLFLEPADVRWDSGSVSCAIRKDAGDDPDVTDGLFIYALVRLCDREACADSRAEASSATVSILGGDGIGIVTLPGLEQQVGAPAINRVPRDMIRSEVQKICREFRYSGGIEVTISAPEGKKVAERTFNPRLGIRDGISILGTSGIVEPMSEQALLSTIELEMRQKAVSQRYLLVTPGNYGAEYLKGHFPFEADQAVKCSNYVGRTIDIAVSLELSGLLFVAHIGKFIKVAGGIMNTHSGEADARMEILAACALRAGIDADGARRILDAATTDEGLRIIREAGLWKPVTDFILEKINVHLNRRAQNRMRIGAVVFSNVYGELGRTEAAGELVESLLQC
ncbi:MAG: cobalt-precorrin-5B (C(1))-methyltransferase CbiD [Clostridiales bacterium]|nr:cobalt-precorrin-5B (C(1))-methyltransferase CbiD [Clostridiales bacterium]